MQASFTEEIMKTAVLDGLAVNPGDLDWSWLGDFGEYTVYDKTSDAEKLERAADCDAVITNKVTFGRTELDNLPKVKYIGVTATGFNIIDTEYAAERGVIVTNVPAYSTESVAQHTFALMLEMMTEPALHSASVKCGEWTRNNYFCYTLTPQTEIFGKTLGIIGAGAIGTRVSEIAHAFGMKTLMCGRSEKAGRVSLERVLAESDIITLHCPLNCGTERLVNRETIAKMKDGVKLINTARGGIVDEDALADALASGKVAYYAADVISSEPPENNNPLICAEHTLITPHLAWATLEARTRLMKTVEANFRAYLAGKPVNCV